MSNSPDRTTTPIELLSPAGDWLCARAAVENGADAIYFGLDCGFNARHRAKNFGLNDLRELMAYLRRRQVRGYATINTLVFPGEMAALVEVIEAIATAGVDAVLVQDFGVARIVREVCPELEVHASTQMSLTSAETIEVARQLGLARVVLARELSVDEIRKIATATTMPLEVFIHGALCVAYSGQCLTSESLGGRSANRGQCAQACRLPYDLTCDGNDVDLGDVRFLLSPQDLAGYAAIPDLISAGVRSLKIEGRLKTPEYVANITSHYRSAIDQAMHDDKVTVDEAAKREMELSFSRGFAPGWLEGNDHKRLVPGLQSAKRGIRLGKVASTSKRGFEITLEAPIAPGDGLMIGDLGGRVYSIHTPSGGSRKQAIQGETVSVGMGKGEIDWLDVSIGTTVFKNDDPKLNRRLRQTFSGDDPNFRRPIDIEVEAIRGKPLRVWGRVGSHSVGIDGDEPLAAATKHPANESVLREKLGRLGGSPFQLRELSVRIEAEPMVPMAMLNQARRQLVDAMLQELERPQPRTVSTDGAARLLAPIRSAERTHVDQTRLAVLCRSLEQVRAASETDVDLLYADFHDVRLYGEAVDTAKSAGKPIYLCSVRMQKPGEMGLLKVLMRHEPHGLLARNLAAVEYGRAHSLPTIADFSLNVANHRSAEWLRMLGAERVTASYDLNSDQLIELVGTLPANWMEVVIHQHMPMFHMEHCVFCSVLSPGTDKTNCGRPCDDHQVQLRDRVGAEHPLHADVACRNTLYNSTPQSGAELTKPLIRAGTSWFRVELLEDSAEQTAKTLDLYRRLLRGDLSARDVWQALKATNRVGVTRGTLEPKRDPLAII